MSCTRNDLQNAHIFLSHTVYLQGPEKEKQEQSMLIGAEKIMVFLFSFCYIRMYKTTSERKNIEGVQWYLNILHWFISTHLCLFFFFLHSYSLFFLIPILFDGIFCLLLGETKVLVYFLNWYLYNSGSYSIQFRIPIIFPAESSFNKSNIQKFIRSNYTNPSYQ